MAGASLLGKVCPVLEDYCRIRNVGLGYASSRTAGNRLNASTSAEAATTSLRVDEGSIRWAQLAIQGPRPEMEDDVQIEDSKVPGFTYAAVFDGHAGFSSASFLKNELLNECVQALQGGSLLQSNDSTELQKALSQAFLQADKRLLSCLAQAESESDSGSTATVLFIGQGKAVVAHVGDSRVVLSRQGKAEVLTADHRPYGSGQAAVSEVKRVRAAGGWISNGRVCGYLSVSRAFGNMCLKTRRQEMLQEGLNRGRWTSKFVARLDLTGDWLVAEPDVRLANLGSDAEFIILASDGLWDSMKSSEAVTFVRDQLREHGDTQRACEALASAALSRNGQDNVSIIIADLGRISRQEGLAKREGLSQQEGFTQQHDLALALKQVLITSGLVLLGYYMTQLAGATV